MIADSPSFMDTNLFIRYLTNDDPQKAEAVERLLLKAKSGKIKLVELSEKDAQELKAAGRKSWEVSYKKSETSAKLIDLLTEYLKEKGVY